MLSSCFSSSSLSCSGDIRVHLRQTPMQAMNIASASTSAIITQTIFGTPMMSCTSSTFLGSLWLTGSRIRRRRARLRWMRAGPHVCAASLGGIHRKCDSVLLCCISCESLAGGGLFNIVLAWWPPLAVTLALATRVPTVEVPRRWLLIIGALTFELASCDCTPDMAKQKKSTAVLSEIRCCCFIETRCCTSTFSDKNDLR